MRKIFTLALLIVTLSAYSQNYDKKIVGAWIIKDIQISNLEGLAQGMIDIQSAFYEKQIEIYTEKIFALEDEIKSLKDYNEIENKKIEIVELRQKITDNSEQMAKLTLDYYVNDMKKMIDEFKKNVQFTFYEDKKFTYSADQNYCNYSFKEDNTKLVLEYEGNKIEIFKIKKLNKKHFIFVSEQEEVENIYFTTTYILLRTK